ncbi:MAG: BREX system ATP-binding domain-containing protein [Candidatus Promineifilaceae bacterium]|nr:BREX system ATP-binding domain-containing protein [Candidatus Promineifilaceae bacterium]
MLEIRLLGRFELRADGAAVELSSRPAQVLLAYLALQDGVAQRREKLAGLIWPEATEENARTYLRQALWRVRKAIGAEYVAADKLTVALSESAAIWLDVAVLEKAPAGGWTVESLMAAAEVYEGELLPGFYDDWVTLERERLAAVYERRMEQLLDLLVAQARWDDTRLWAERWIAAGGVPEPAYRALMQAQAGLGDMAAMVAAYQRCAEALEAELGVEPSQVTKQLLDRLKSDGVSSTAIAPAQGPSVPSFLEDNAPHPPARAGPFVGREQELAVLEDHLEAALAGQGQIVFVTGEAGQGKTTLLNAFARRARAVHAGTVVASGACPVYTPVCAPYGLFREVLEALTGNIEPAWASGTINRDQALRLWRSVPQTVATILRRGPNLIDTLVSGEGLLERAQMAGIEPAQLERLKAIQTRSDPRIGRLSDQGQLFAEFAEVLVALAARQPLLLIVDDLHWADPSSIGLLGHLGHRLAESAIMILGAYRPEELSQGRAGAPHPLLPVLSEYKRRFGDVTLDLSRVELESGRSFVDALLDQEPNALGPAFRQALTHHTGGHPLFTVALLEEMQAQGKLRRDSSGRWIEGPDLSWDVMPPRVEGVIESRINRLEPELRRWLEVASVEGESFTAEVIAQVEGIQDSVTVRRLSNELDRQHRLVAAQGIQSGGSGRLSLYHFRHNLFRQYLYNQLDDIERSYLHQQVGEALEALFEGQTKKVADQLAHHFQMAALDAKTITYLAQAGDNAVQAYAYDEAKAYYEQALALAREANGAGEYHQELTSLYTKLGRIFEHRSDTKSALAIYREMEQRGKSRSDRPMILKALSAQGTLYSIPSFVQDPIQGRTISEKALALAQELGDRAAEARLLWNLMLVYEYDNQLAQAIEFGERSLMLAHELGLQRQLAFTLSDLAGCYWIVGQIDKARRLSQEATDIWREANNLPMLADALIQSSFATMFQGDYDEAVAQSDEAWQISQSIGNKWNLAFSRSRIGFVHRVRGELGLSIAIAEQSLQLGQTHDITYPQIFAGAELAFGFAYLGAAKLGLDKARAALVVADERGPSYRPYLQAALAQNYLVNGDLGQAEAAVRQAESDPHWQAFPVLCIALTLVDGRLALARTDYDRALQVADGLLDLLGRFGMRAYLSEVLDLSGLALSKLDRQEEARRRFERAREVAEATGARGSLWPILLHLSQLEPEPPASTDLRRQAKETIEFIVDNVETPSLRASFLALPEVRAVIESGG